jgi:glucan phosphoethanolaminetransferase (alkaline phosphatase superfamily)
VIILITKSLVFLFTSDFKKIRAAWYVIVASFFSTLIGLLVAIMFMSPDYLLVGIVIIFLISIFPAARLKLTDRYQKHSKFTITFAVAVITLIMIVLFAHSIGYQAPANITLVAKIIFSILATALCLILSIVYDESIIYRLYHSSTRESKSFIKPALWSNIISVLVIIILAGIWILTAGPVTADIRIGEILFSLPGI